MAHVILALLYALLTTACLVWRMKKADRALDGGQGLAFILTMVAGLWMLLGAGQVGGGISDR